MARRTTISLGLLLLLATLPAGAQKIQSSTRIAIPSGEGYATFTMDKGEMVSENGVAVRFEPERNPAGELVGYKYDKSQMDSLQAGDRIALFIHDIDWEFRFGSGYIDNDGKKLLGTADGDWIKGGWKAVTIESFEKGDKALIHFVETAKLRRDKTTREIRLTAKDGWYLTERTKE